MFWLMLKPTYFSCFRVTHFLEIMQPLIIVQTLITYSTSESKLLNVAVMAFLFLDAAETISTSSLSSVGSSKSLGQRAYNEA